MRKSFVLIIVIMCAALLAGCEGGTGAGAAAPDIQAPAAASDLPAPSPDPKAVVDITDLAAKYNLPADTAMELFYEDEAFEYYFSSIISHYVIVSYADGSERPVKEALADGGVTIADLERFGISFHAMEKPGADTPAG